MSLVRRFTDYLHDVVDTVQDVLAADDPLLCDCHEGAACLDCGLLAPADLAPAWPAPLDAA